MSFVTYSEYHELKSDKSSSIKSSVSPDRKVYAGISTKRIGRLRSRFSLRPGTVVQVPGTDNFDFDSNSTLNDKVVFGVDLLTIFHPFVHISP